MASVHAPILLLFIWLPTWEARCCCHILPHIVLARLRKSSQSGNVQIRLIFPSDLIPQVKSKVPIPVQYFLQKCHLSIHPESIHPFSPADPKSCCSGSRVFQASSSPAGLSSFWGGICRQKGNKKFPLIQRFLLREQRHVYSLALKSAAYFLAHNHLAIITQHNRSYNSVVTLYCATKVCKWV